MNEDPGIMPRMITAEMPGSATFEPLGVGSKVGPYRLARKIGRGGMGVVYEGIHERIGQRAAVKILLRGEREGEREIEASAVERFLTEARALSRVEHPGLVRIFDCGETERGTPWISMELLDGEMLRERIERASGSRWGTEPRRSTSRGSGLPVTEAIRTARQLASAVAAIHRAGVIHRDLKPDNVMVVADEEAPGGERVKLLDFGIAKLAGDATATAEGTVIGTAAYMAPEQCVGSAAIDERADVYALGVVIYEMLAGTRPFVGDPADVMRQHLFAEPPPIQEDAADLPEGLADLVRAMMAKEPSLRPDLALAIEDLRAMELALGPPAPRGSRPRDGEGGAESEIESARTEPVTAADELRFPRTGPAEGFATAPARGALTEPRPSEKSLAREGGAGLENKGETGQSTAESAPDAPEPAKKPMASPRRGRGLIAGVVAVIALGAAALVATIYPGKKPPAKVALPGMARVEGGTFRMGSTDAEIAAACSALPGGCAPEAMPQLQREKPAHDVTVSPFQIDVHEVTNAEYAAFLHVVAALVDVREDKDDHSARFVIERATGMLLIDLHPAFGGVARTKEGQFVARPGRERWPVSQVTWDGASRYCRQAGKRLPTEAEWELAAGGLGSRRFPWGDAPPRCEGVVFGRSPQAGCESLPAEPRDVGTSPQDVSPEGVFDLAGNVGEWVQDQFALAYYPDCGACRDPVTEANVPVAEDMRLLRGGTFRSPAYVSRATTRSRWKRTDVMDGLGFRCASR